MYLRRSSIQQSYIHCNVRAFFSSVVLLVVAGVVEEEAGGISEPVIPIIKIAGLRPVSGTDIIESNRLQQWGEETITSMKSHSILAKVMAQNLRFVLIR